MSEKRNANLSSEEKSGDAIIHNQIRPQLISDFIGNEALKSNLKVFIDAAKKREEPLDHILLHGPPGLGKTTLAQIISNEMSSSLRQTVGPALNKPGDLAAILSSLRANDILFVDEIHRMNKAVEEMLYSAMEDFAIDIVIGEGAGARTMRLKLHKFTLIGATTRLGLLSKPFKDRFGIPLKMDFYDVSDISKILFRASKIMSILSFSEEAYREIAMRSRGTPRVALRLLRRLRDFASLYDGKEVNLPFAKEALDRLHVNESGLDITDIKYISYIMEKYEGGPVGIDTIAAGLSEDRDTLEEDVEPYLMRIGFLSRTPRGRQLSNLCRDYIASEKDRGRYNFAY